MCAARAHTQAQPWPEWQPCVSAAPLALRPRFSGPFIHPPHQPHVMSFPSPQRQMRTGADRRSSRRCKCNVAIRRLPFATIGHCYAKRKTHLLLAAAVVLAVLTKLVVVAFHCFGSGINLFRGAGGLPYGWEGGGRVCCLLIRYITS